MSERSLQPTAAQIKVLLDQLEKNPDIAKGFLKTFSARQRARTFWAQMQTQLNSMSGGASKTWKQWMKYWTDKKSATKKKAAQRNAYRTNGAAAEVELTPIDDRIVAILNGEFIANGVCKLETQLIHESSDQEVLIDIEQILPEAIVISQDPTISESESLPAEPESPPTARLHPSRMRTLRQSPRRQHTDPRRRIRVQGSPTPQRQNQLVRITDRFLRLEERRIGVEESNASLLRALLERTAQREHTLLEALTSIGNRMIQQHSQHNAVMADALKTLGEGLKALRSTNTTCRCTNSRCNNS